MKGRECKMEILGLKGMNVATWLGIGIAMMWEHEFSDRAQGEESSFCLTEWREYRRTSQR